MRWSGALAWRSLPLRRRWLVLPGVPRPGWRRREPRRIPAQMLAGMANAVMAAPQGLTRRCLFVPGPGRRRLSQADAGAARSSQLTPVNR
jgi:hypothetical protein